MVATPVERRLISQAYVKLDGVELDQSMMEDLLRIRVDGSVNLPDLAILEFDNVDFKWSDGPEIKIGQGIELLFGDADLKSAQPVFSGEVTALEVEVGMTGRLLMRVRCYDRAHRLHRGRKTQVYKQMTDADIMRKVAQGAGLQSDVKSTRGVHEYVLQDNQTDWEFLQQRAAFHGYEVQVDGRKLVCKPPPSVPRQAVSLKWQEELLSFKATMSTGEQVDEVQVRGWDPNEKKEIIGRASKAGNLPSVGESRTGGDLAKRAFGASKMVVTREPVYTQEEAQTLAQAVLDELGGSFITAQGTAMGDPRLQLGSEVELLHVGRQFTGKYIVTQITHRYEPEGYEIDFEVTGRRSTDLVSLMAQPEEPAMHAIPGLVTDNTDPKNQGRVKVKFPWLGENIESDWCRLVTLGGGAQRGLEFIPEVDDEVLLIGSSMDRLYVLGGLWNQKDVPPYKNQEASDAGKVTKRAIRSRAGHEILIDDTQGAGGITIVDSTGKNKLQINTQDNSLLADVQGDVTIKSLGTIELSAAKEFKVSAGTNITEEAQASASYKANAQASFEGQAGVQVQTSGQATVRGAMVNIG